MRSLAILLALFASFSLAHAADSAPPARWFARIALGQEPMTYDGTAVHVGDYLDHEGYLKTGDQGGALVTFRELGAVLSVAAGTNLKVVKPEKGDPKNLKTYILESGKCRWQVRKNEQHKHWIRVKTASATMGVRGTDFLAVSTPLLGESEIVVFDGAVTFANSADPKDSKEVPAGHWGGIGGRFGKKVSDLMALPPNVLEALRQPVEIPAAQAIKD